MAQYGGQTAVYGNSTVDFQSYAGPGDKALRNDEVRGYQPVSRIGEVVVNSFVDSYEFASVQSTLSVGGLTGETPADDAPQAVKDAANVVVEFKPHWHEWATVQPGMICLARKKRTVVFRQYMAAETAAPVIACCACLPKADESQWFFAGVARSKSVREIDDGIGPATDEFFTLSIGGMVTMLNTSGSKIHPGDLVSWTFASKGTHKDKRSKSGPRRVALEVTTTHNERVFGRALSFAMAGEVVDILVKQ